MSLSSSTKLHTVVGAGAAEGAIDAANILKPALAGANCSASGPRPWTNTANILKRMLPWNGATSLSPSVSPREDTVAILRGLRDRYEAHHRVKITDEA